MSTLEFFGVIENGFIRPPVGFAPYFRAHHLKQVRVTVSKNIKKRSLNQNSFYWGVVIPNVRQFRMDNGDTVSNEQVHEDLIAEFAPNIVRSNIDGTFGSRQKRSHEMNKQEMCDFITAIMARLAYFGFHINMENYNATM